LLLNVLGHAAQHVFLLYLPQIVSKMNFEIKGKLIVKYDTQQVTDKFRKREFVLEIPNGAYSESVKFQLTQDKCSMLDSFGVGDELKAFFVLRGRPYSKGGETTYFTNLEAWKLETAQPAGQTKPDTHFEADTTGFTFTTEAAGADDLPF
jgi:single-strand DNA-binding protein